MITNERQERITKTEIRKFEDALASLVEQDFDGNTDDDVFRQMQVDAMRSQLNDLRSEVAVYEATKSGRHPVLQVESLDQLPEALISARIASGMTQEDLANRIGIHEQQIQRYEASRYSSASLKRLTDVVKALGVGIREEVLLPADSASPRTLFSRLGAVGVDREMVMERILPSQVRADLESIDESVGDSAQIALQAASAVGRVFGLLPSTVFGTDPLLLNAAAVGVARYSTRANANERRLIAFTTYAHYLARLVVKATPELESGPVPTNPVEFRSQVIRAYGAFGFDQALRFAWDLGIAVLPLSDFGAFHGAFWRIGGRNIIILKQRTGFVSRSLVDLLHEICHAGENPDLSELSVIEEGETLRQRKTTKGERRAAHFAVASALNGREEELARTCYEAAGKVERLSVVVPAIAEREGVDVGVLADYLAYRLAFERPPVQWWPAATNLQPRNTAHWKSAETLLLERVDLMQVDRFDRELLIRAMSNSEE